MGWLDRLTGKAPVESAPEPVAAGKPVSADAGAADGIHHEFFIDDEPVNGRIGWLCRVYAPGGVLHQSSGSEETNQSAVQAAIGWAESTKAELRRAE